MTVATPAEMFASSLRSMLDARLEDVHISLPGRIESYDRERQAVVVQPLVKRMFKDPSGELRATSYPAITDVPVEFLGGGEYALTFPVARGMTCRLDFCSASLDKFLALGGEVDPEDPRRFTLSDAVCVLGLRDFRHALKNLPADAWVVACPSTSQIRLGAVDAAQKAIRGDAFKTAFDTLIDSIATAVGTIPGGGAASTAISTAKGVFDAAASSWLSSIVRIK